MSVPSSLVPQLLFNTAVLVGLLAYLPRAVRRKKLRFAVTVLALVVMAALYANLRGYAIQGPVQGFELEKV